MQPVSLRQVLSGVEIKGQVPEEILRTVISGLTMDSRQVEEGSLFVAIKGLNHDGHDFLLKAMSNGAKAALVEKANHQVPLAQLVVDDTRQALALAAMNIYGNPDKGMNVIGVTGTNGKTTTTYLLEALLGQDSGLMGTVQVRYAGKQLASNMTTPDPLTLAACLHDMCSQGVKNLVMEVSSHALEQKRVDGLDFNGAIFTNLSRDHLDYHQDMDNYFAAKKRLFSQLLPKAKDNGKKTWAVLNMQDSRVQELLDVLRVNHIPVMTYGDEGQITAHDVRYSVNGIQAILHTPQGQMLLTSELIGDFNLQNLMAAVAAGLCMEMPLSHITKSLTACTAIPGRLEKVGSSPMVLVDYAHTDDALYKALSVLRPLTNGRLLCLFGAGGNRDQGKRPLMGKAVAQTADMAIVTSDNPRMEDPLSIIDMIIPGLKQGGMQASEGWSLQNKTFIVEPDREKAIKLAISHAAANDVLLIAGKGHEDYQTIGREDINFDDRQKARQALGEREQFNV